MNASSWFWIGWGAVGVAAEIAALRARRSGDTLSENIRGLARAHPAALHLFRVVWALFAVWFLFHI